jgi:tRNA(adenine34) deaminase
MNAAFEEAEKAFKMDEVPVGAVIVRNGNIIASAHNLVEKNKNSLCHAEILCIEKASLFKKNRLLSDCDLYVTLEPCAMCAGAIANSHIKRLFFGAYDPKGGCVEHGSKIFSYTLHKPEIYGGIMEKKCGDLLKLFFDNKR